MSFIEKRKMEKEAKYL
jgi:hypothetical protein